MPTTVSFPTQTTLAAGLSALRFPTSNLLLNVAQAVKASAGNIYGLKFINSNTSPVYVKIYDKAAASVVPGTDIPADVYEVPANDGTNNGQLIIAPGAQPLHTCLTAISILATTVYADNGTQTAPGAGLMGKVTYQ